MPLDLFAPMPGKDGWSEGLNHNDQYVMTLKSVLHEINVQARGNLKSASLKQCRYYNNRLVYYQYKEGDLVYYYYSVKTKHTSKENFHAWRGPLVVVKKLSGCLYRIQESPTKQLMVVHHNKLKKAHVRNPPYVSWVSNIPTAHMVNPGVELQMDEVPDNGRQKREVQPPQMYGEWYM